MADNQIVFNLRHTIRDDWCDQIAAAFEAQETLQKIYDHAEQRARRSETAISATEWAATFGPMSRAAGAS
jgi:hypothetical protein